MCPFTFERMRWMRWVVVAPAGMWALVRIAGWDSWYPAVQLIAFTPYVAVLSLIPWGLTVLWRRWDAVIAAGVITVLLTVCVLPRGLEDSDPLAGAKGRELKVLTVNILFGHADFGRVLELSTQADVVMVQELVPAFAEKLEPHFPYHVKGGEVGIYSRLTLKGHEFRPNPMMFGQITAELPGANVMLQSVHTVAPSEQSRVEPWLESFRRQQRAEPDGPMWILAGDFNATLDHAVMRNLVRSGYRDAAAVVGKGWTGTWGPYDGDNIPPVTLDRVLADRRIGIKDVEIFEVPGSDHRAVLVTLVLP